MKYFRLVLLIFLAGLVVILDTSFFSFINLGGASILSSFALIMVFSLFGHRQELLTLSLTMIILLSALSSLSVWFILCGYLILPSFLVYIKTNFLPEASLFTSYIFFCFACLVFEVLLMISTGALAVSAFSVVGYFILLNSVVTMIIYIAAIKIRQKFLRAEIKI